MRRTILICLALATLAGCAPQVRQANYRPPRPDELRPGDTPPPPGPFIESYAPPQVQQQPPQVYLPPMPQPYQLPTGDALRAQQPQPYMMPPLRQTVCNTQRFGNQLQTVCQ